jgi:hypothetical protein
VAPPRSLGNKEAGYFIPEPFEKSEKTKSTSLKSFSLKKSEKNILNMCAIRLPENVCDGHTRLALPMPACSDNYLYIFTKIYENMNISSGDANALSLAASLQN